MPLWALWRRNWAVWMMPITGLIVATVNNNQLAHTDGYPYWIAGEKTYALAFLGVLTCLAGAAEGGWQRRSRLVERPAARSFSVRFGIPVAMTWLPTAALFVIGVAVVGGISAWQMWTTSLFSMFAWTCFGFALGVMLRATISLPLSVLSAFGWFLFTPSIEPPWPRHLSATWDGCCTTPDVPNTTVMMGIVVFALGLILTAGCLVWIWSRGLKPRAGWAAGAALPVIVGLMIAGMLTNQIGHSPTQPRTDQVVCWPGTPEICLWPERRPDGDADVASIRTITSHWASMGVHLPGRLSEDRPYYRDGTAPLVFSHRTTQEWRATWLAQGLATGCESDTDETPTAGLDYFTMRDWLAHYSGIPNASDMISDDLKPLLKKPLGQQLKLINSAFSARARCR